MNKWEKQNYKHACQLHFNGRASERLGLKLNRHDARSILDTIKANPGQPYPTFNDPHRLWYFVDYEGNWIWVLYDKKLKRLVTCLSGDDVPREAWNTDIGGNDGQ